MDWPAAGAGDEMHVRERADHPPSKRARTDGTRPTLHDMFEEILEEKGAILRNESALRYWRNGTQIPMCTSTDSERLFSSASHILDEKRNRLSCNKAETLIFVKKNMHITEK